TERANGHPDRASGPPQRTPGAPPERKHGAGTRYPQPGDADRLDPCEEKHGERGAQVVEDRAADEVELRWSPQNSRAEHRAPARRRRYRHFDMVAAKLQSWNGRSTEISVRCLGSRGREKRLPPKPSFSTKSTSDSSKSSRRTAAWGWPSSA